MILVDNGLSFGDYRSKSKIKVNDFEHLGDFYKLRSHDLVTRLERNGELLVEAVPGAAFRHFAPVEGGWTFEIEGAANVQVTMSLCPEAVYDLAIMGPDGNDIHSELTANRSGKLSFGLNLAGGSKTVGLKKL